MESKAQNLYLNFTRINAVSYASQADAMLILYAIKAGANDFQVGLIMSFFYLTLPFIVLGKSTMARHGASRTIYLAWMFRNSFALLLIPVPFLSRWLNPGIGFFCLTLGSFGFFAFRSFGMAAITPLIADISSPPSRGKFIANTWLHSNIFNLGTVLAIIVVTYYFTTIAAFQAILFSGAVTGILAGRYAYKISPFESEQPQLSARQPLRHTLHFILRNRSVKILLLNWTLLMSLLMLVITFSLVGLKNGYAFSDHGVLIFALIQIAGSILSAYANSLLLDRVGPRPMIILYTFLLLFVCIHWLFAPQIFFWPLFFMLFFLIGICNSGINTCISHYLLASVPSQYTVGTSLILTAVSGLGAGLAGTFLGGGLIDVLRSFNFDGLLLYKIYFAIVLVLGSGIVFVTFRLYPLADRRVKDVLGILVSYREWRALFALQKLSETQTEAQNKHLIYKLGEIGSGLSEESLVSFLNSPSFLTRTHALRALRHIPFGENTVQKLIREVNTGEYTTGFLAADLLAEHKIRKSVPALRQALDSRDPLLKGRAMLALAILDDRESFSRIITIFTATKNPHLILLGTKAFVFMHDADLTPLFFKLFNQKLPSQIQNEMLYSFSELCGLGHIFHRIQFVFHKETYTADDLDAVFQLLSMRVKKCASMKKVFQERWVKHSAKMKFLQHLTELAKTGKSHAHVKSLMRYFIKYPVGILTDKFRFFLLLIVLLSHEPVNRTR